MISIKPADAQPYILTFGGTVLEIFAKFRDETHRIHVTQIQSIQVNTDKKGNHELEIKVPGRVMRLFPVDAAQYAKATELVAAVRKAMADFKF
jgi:hypothetical protein